MLSQDEIDNLLSSLSVGIDKPLLSDDNTEEQVIEKRNYKLYNFRRPDKFSKDHLRALQTLHETFARQMGLVLTAYLRSTVEIDVVSVDQLTYDEFIRSMPSPMTVSILEMAPLPGQVLFGLGYEVTSSIIDRMLGGPGVSEPRPRELTDIEQSLIKRVIDRAMTALEDAWRSMLDVETSLVATEESYALIQVATPGEMVALVTLEINVGNKDSGLISLCFPYPVLESVIRSLSSQRIFHGQHSDVPVEQQQQVLQKLHHAKMPVEVLLGGTTITVKDLLDLRVGDVVCLDRLAHESLLVCVNHRPKFFARPGTLKNNLAVYINESVADEEAIEGFGLYDTKQPTVE
ncbi:MAG: flagellar motor switch protein FliM [Cyanobacteria bacterium]|nr:flagellar motor switch protein FliM [Cyanobacteriota bacterium]